MTDHRGKQILLFIFILIGYTECLRKDLPKRKLYVSHDTQSNARIPFYLIEEHSKFHLVEKSVHKYCLNISIFILTQDFRFPKYQKNLKTLSQTLFNVSVFYRLYSFSNPTHQIIAVFNLLLERMDNKKLIEKCLLTKFSSFLIFWKSEILCQYE